ncbi:hypothetical protein [Bacillus toyonensis]|uniref:hypothetical protein n=1 Tax=Bacillus toyonensis TaxID=155322 RepID=UPI0018D0E709|nr:hypothetical protein [Bacillus toyonensis]MBH0357251.1 hypothetical protein [Bacillus toyonensis biovar Thuringiensis]
MKVGEVIERLNNGTKAAALAKELNVADKRFREGLKKIGFEYSNSLKAWGGGEDAEEYLDKSVFDYVPPKGNRGMKSTSQSSNKEVKKRPQRTARIGNVNSSNGNIKDEIQFTQAEILALKEIANQFIDEQANETHRERLHKRIIKLPNEDMTRKTVVINKAIGERLDAYASKMKFNKSDILSLALADFLDRYEGEEE